MFYFYSSTIYICVLQLYKKAIFPIGKGISNLSIYINQDVLQISKCFHLCYWSWLNVFWYWMVELMTAYHMTIWQRRTICHVPCCTGLFFKRRSLYDGLDACKSIFWKYILTVETTKRCKQNIESLEYYTQETYSIEI